MRVPMRVLLCSASICALGAPAAMAQTVRGVARSGSSSQPTAGAVILFADSLNAVVARTITSTGGGYQVRLPSPGRYELRVVRIGFQPFVQKFAILADTTINLSIINVPAALARITVEDSRQCRIRSDEAQATFQLWDEVGKALLATQITRESQHYTFVAAHHRRIFRNRDLYDVTLADRQSEGLEPWTSLHPDSLARGGYVEEREGAMHFVAPDIDVMLSRSFVTTHCLRLAPVTETATTLDIEFEPLSGIRHPDIRGRVTIERATRELRSIEYWYTNLPFITDRTRAEGRVEFEKLAGGGWITPRWVITTPIPERTGPQFGINGGLIQTNVAGRRRASDRTQVSGADLRAVFQRNANDSTLLWKNVTTSLPVSVATENDEPVAGALVRIVGSATTQNTAADGVARFEQLLPGAYLIEATSADLMALDGAAATATLTVTAGNRNEARLRLPAIGGVLRKVCGNGVAQPNVGVVTGYVFADGRAMEGVTVKGSWSTEAGAPLPPDIRMANARDSANVTNARLTPVVDIVGQTTTRSDGRYFLCGASTKHWLTLRVAKDSAAASASVRAAEGSLVMKHNFAETLNE
jgi:Carboxypeptidase regulatory-like domain